MPRTPRRQFLQQAALAGGAAITVPLQSLLSAAAGGGVSFADGYGGLRPVKDDSTGLPLLELPEGFRYVTFGWAGDPMDGGLRTPGLHDGMAAFDGPDGTVQLIRNHEIAAGRTFDPSMSYDEGAGGGTTTLTFDPKAGRAHQHSLEHRRHLSQLRRRRHAVEQLAHVRGNDDGPGG